jgi:hypothetical protein
VIAANIIARAADIAFCRQRRVAATLLIARERGARGMLAEVPAPVMRRQLILA